MNIRNLCNDIISGHRIALSKAITLIESSLKSDRQDAYTLMRELQQFLPQPHITYRIGISGPPGAGKSTFLEHFGMFILDRIDSDNKIAILALDPSSEISGGSLLGDKTRMQKLSCDSRCFIRPSPTRGHMGGVAKSTCDSVRLCEASGHNFVFIETVGVGQSETMASDMTDVFIVLIPPSGGDELQGLKKGIIEKADILIVHKADGDLLPAAKRTQAEYTSAFKLHRSTMKININQRISTWIPKVCAVSSKKGTGFDILWKYLQEFKANSIESGDWIKKRSIQDEKWHTIQVREELDNIIHDSIPELKKIWERIHPDRPIISSSPRIVALDMFRSLISGENKNLHNW